MSSTGGEDPIVRFYWGDNDGGTNSSAWDHAYSSGSQSAGGLTHSISGLLPSTQYYFRAWAQNQAGATYSTPYAFSTTPNNPPSALTVNGTLSIQENQTVGTVVGEFNATDQDTGASFSYALVNGVGDSEINILVWIRMVRFDQPLFLISKQIPLHNRFECESRMNTMEHSKVLSMLQLRMMDCMMERPKFLQFLEARSQSVLYFYGWQRPDSDFNTY